MSEDSALDVVIGAGSGIGGALIERWQSAAETVACRYTFDRGAVGRGGFAWCHL